MSDLERLPRTDSNAVRKDDAIRWLGARERPSDHDLLKAVVTKPYGMRGSTFTEPISDIRIKGDAEFVETVAGLLRPFLALEGHTTRLEINLQKVTDRDTGAETEAWSLYIKGAERGGGRKPRTLDSIPEDLHAILR